MRRVRSSSFAKLRRGGVLAFFGRLAPCVVAVEACASAHHWGREIAALGHEVKLIPPAHVKPYVRRNKTDAADAASWCGARGRSEALGFAGQATNE